jgi:hypothetical protein
MKKGNIKPIMRNDIAFCVYDALVMGRVTAPTSLPF